MKESKFRWVWLALMLGAVVAGAADAPPAEAPTELRLTSGAVLRDVSVVRYQGADTVVIKHAGGVDPIRLPYIAEPGRGQLVAYKKEWAKMPAGQPQFGGEKRTLSGQVFVTTAGKGAYKFAGTRVFIFARSDRPRLRALQSNRRPMTYNRLYDHEKQEVDAIAWGELLAADNLPAPLVVGATDADGNYRLEFAAKEEVTLVCYAKRYTYNHYEHDLWLIDIAPETTNLSLNGLNLLQPE